MISKQQILGVVTAAIMATAPIASAQQGTTWFGDSADGQWLAGIKYGTMTNDDPGFQDVDAYTLVLGYQFSRAIGTDGTSSIEFEFTDTDEGDFNNGVPNSTWDALTYGLFINYRTPGTVYFKGKLGILSSKVRSEIAGVQLEDSSSAALAYGAGIGVRMGAQQNINLELEWMGASGDNDLSHITVGGSILF